MGHLGPGKMSYLFIDGGCLRQMAIAASEDYVDYDFTKIDFSKVAKEYTKTFYYDAHPPRKTQETEEDYSKRIDPQDSFFDSLRTIRGMHVYEGDSRRRRRVVEQKKVDVMIAVDMLTHAFRGNMHKATILTADLDLKPLIDALVQNGMQVQLMYPHGKPNKELIHDFRISINILT